MSPTVCALCETTLTEKGVCPSCGWIAAPKKPSKRNRVLDALGLYALILGSCGACGFLAYTGTGAIFGFGPLGGQVWAKVAAIGLVAIYVIVYVVKTHRRRG